MAKFSNYDLDRIECNENFKLKKQTWCQKYFGFFFGYVLRRIYTYIDVGVRRYS
jgi:hypothetical protein